MLYILRLILFIFFILFPVIQGRVGEIIEVEVSLNGVVERFPADIDTINPDGTYNVRYANGKLGRNIKHNSIIFVERGQIIYL